MNQSSTYGSLKRRFGVMVGVAVFGVSMLASPAAAQPGGGFGGAFGGMGGGMGREMFAAPFSTREMERYGEFLGLTQEQREVVRMLVEAQVEAFQAQARVVRDKMDQIREEFREYRDPSVWEGMQGVMENFRRFREESEKTLLGDVQAILTSAQAERWPALERTMRRDRTIRRGLMSGERLDLVRMVEEANLEADVKAPLEPVLEQYAIDLDRALIQRNAFQDEAMQRMGEIMRNQDMDTAQKLLEEGRQYSVAVKDINRRYARQIESMLPDGAREAFAAQVARVSFPDVYRPSYTSRALDAAIGFNDLTEDQKARITAIRDSFNRETNVLNRRLAEAIEQSEMTMTVQQMFRRGFGGEEGQDAELRRQKRDLDRSSLERLRDVLTQAQIQRLPSRDEGDRRGGPGQGGGQQQQRRVFERNPPT